jgi:anti-sigma B factor antagonist
MSREHGGQSGRGVQTLRVERHVHDRHVYVNVAGEIDAASSGAFSDELIDAAQLGSGPVVVNLGHVSFLDSSGLHALVNARVTAGSRLQLGTVNPAVRRVLEMTSLLNHLQRSDDPTEPD